MTTGNEFENEPRSTVAWMAVAIILALLLLLCAAYNEIVKSHQVDDAANLKISALTAELKTLKEKSNDRSDSNPAPHSDARASCASVPSNHAAKHDGQYTIGGQSTILVGQYDAEYSPADSTSASGLLPQRGGELAECPQVDEARLRAAAELADQIVSEVRASQK